MYINQIDNIIDQILNKLYLEGLSQDETFKMITEGKLNFVEYRDKINSFIQKFMDTIDIDPIQKLIQNKENLVRIIDIIKRYVAYYYFLSIAYYYQGTIKDFRNNLIQYSKLQETSEFTIKNFFDTENNYQIIMYFKVIKDVANIITMTELQRKTLNPLEVKDAVNFLKTLDTDYINNYLLILTKAPDGSDTVEINVHNLIKTIVFGQIYRNQERNMVFEILNDIEEGQTEYTYIDIVVSTDDVTDFDSFRQIFLGEENMEIIAKDLFELANEAARIPTIQNAETKNSSLLEFKIITPIVDDFLRYHRDSERLDITADKPFILPITNNNAKNIQMALLYQQRKKKENTKAQLIVNKIDVISDLYSENVKNNPELQKDIKKYFQNPFSYRKAVLHNYLDEVHVMKKIRDQGRRAIENNEYYLELVRANRRAYFNFNDFQKYGTIVNLYSDFPLNMLRYSNIEFLSQMPRLEIDMHTGISDHTINMVGLGLGPLVREPIQCVRKENMVDIRNLNITYIKKDGSVVTKSSENGYKVFLKIVKHFYINTITIIEKPTFQIVNDFKKISELNKNLTNKLIYWIYDIDKDEYEMETYENLKTNNFQENIRFMNAIIYDKIIEFLNKQLVKLLDKHKYFSTNKIEALVEIFSTINRLFLKQDDQRELIIEEYLRKKPMEDSRIIRIPESEKITMPEFIPIPEVGIFRIKIDMVNPLHLQEYIKLEAYTKEGLESIISRVESKCQHEIEWKDIHKLKTVNLNKYNAEVTKFIEKFALETTELDFICRICGQMLPLKQYVQDGTFDNNTQKFITAYTPSDVPLEDIKEYQKYAFTIKYLDGLINRISLVTGTNMLVGTTLPIKQKRKALVKNIIDLIIKHNTVNLQKKIDDEERIDFFSKKFHIDKDFDSVFFFELEDNIFNFTPTGSSTDTNLNRLKFNNILLYFILIFITELNGAQISMMTSDKIANIYTFLKYGPRLFGDLLIKKNVSDMETIAINRYPVLCYLIYIIAYFLVKYKFWYYPATTTKTFNPVTLKIIINSLVDLFNSISIDAGRMLSDYVYLLTTSKLYSQLSTTFKNNEIINNLKKFHFRYSDRITAETVPVVKEEIIKSYSIQNPIKIILKPRKIPTFKISSGVIYDRRDELLYPAYDYNNDITNCPYGSYHYWISKGTDIECILCGEKGEEVTGEINRVNETYYYNLNRIASRRCLEGTLHDFVGRGDEFICLICGRKKNEIFTIMDRNELSLNVYKKEKENVINIERLLSKFRKQIQESYSREDLDKLAENLNRLEDSHIQEVLNRIAEQRQEFENEQKEREMTVRELLSEYTKEGNGKLYGQMVQSVDKLITELENLIGTDINLDINKYPVYLRDNVYIIDHSYDGSIFAEPIILTEKDKRIIFKENHPFFKTDVYYYTDNRTQIDVFYHAVTLKLLGYKEKHKEYVLVGRTNNYLKINPSIRQRLLTIGFETKYIDIKDMFSKNSKYIKDANLNFYQILDTLIRDHIFKIKSIIDKIVSILYKVKNFQETTREEVAVPIQTTKEIEQLVSKHAKIIKNFNLGDDNRIFDDWNDIRNYFVYQKINWTETTVRIPENLNINSDLINYYDVSSNVMIYYLVNQLITILDSNNERITKINISQLYIETINYIYNLYNIDQFKNFTELKRFEYILYASDMMIDLLKRGQGLLQSKELEEQLDEIQVDITELTEEEKEEVEDLKEEAEALDIDTDYFAEEEGDYVEGGEEE